MGRDWVADRRGRHYSNMRIVGGVGPGWCWPERTLGGRRGSSRRAGVEDVRSDRIHHGPWVKVSLGAEWVGRSPAPPMASSTAAGGKHEIRSSKYETVGTQPSAPAEAKAEASRTRSAERGMPAERSTKSPTIPLCERGRCQTRPHPALSRGARGSQSAASGARTAEPNAAAPWGSATGSNLNLQSSRHAMPPRIQWCQTKQRTPTKTHHNPLAREIQSTKLKYEMVAPSPHPLPRGEGEASRTRSAERGTRNAGKESAVGMRQ